MITRYKLFFTPSCPYCPTVKAHMKKVNMPGELIDASTPEGLKEAQKYEITKVPTVLFFDESGKKTGEAGSVEEAVKSIAEQQNVNA
jgi:thioredoxin-related protein